MPHFGRVGGQIVSALVPTFVIEDVPVVSDENVAAAKSRSGLEHEGVEAEIAMRFEKHGRIGIV
jgi:hypothetical protein